ncbi:MAG: helix-turn-helix domain-containing protein [Flagellimonas sp.]
MGNKISNNPLGNLLGFENEQEKIELQKEILSLKFVKVIESFIKQNGLKRKNIAKLMGVSQSYLSQVFSANKMVNLEFLVKFQNAIGLPFEVKLGEHNENLMDTVYNKRLDVLSNADLYTKIYPNVGESEHERKCLEG